MKGGSKASELVMATNPKLCDGKVNPVITGKPIEGNVENFSLYKTTGGGKRKYKKSNNNNSNNNSNNSNNNNSNNNNSNNDDIFHDPHCRKILIRDKAILISTASITTLLILISLFIIIRK